jgi:hypothetical protein
MLTQSGLAPWSGFFWERHLGNQPSSPDGVAPEGNNDDQSMIREYFSASPRRLVVVQSLIFSAARSSGAPT